MRNNGVKREDLKKMSEQICCNRYREKNMMCGGE